jgi:drug/metabolite transporter (DMT)-like permease
VIEGVVLALMTGLFWAIGPLCFASIGRRIGAMGILVLGRLIAASLLAVILVVYLLVEPSARQMPGDEQTMWIAASSLLGMVLGDILLYQALVTLGPRRTAQIQMISPLFSASAAWLWMGETMGLGQLVGAAIVMGGIAVAVMARATADEGGREPGTVTSRGVLLAAGSAFLTSLGAVTGRQAFIIGQLDPIVAGTMRVGIAAIVLGLVPLIKGQLPGLFRQLRDPWILQRFAPGVMAGPVLGILCYVGAMKRINPGLLTTLAQTSPLFMMPMIWYRYKAGIGWRAVVATLAAIAGVGVICWR